MERSPNHNDTKSRTDNIAYVINQSVPVLAILSGVAMIVVASLPQIPESRTSPLHTAGFSLFTLAGGAFTQRRKTEEGEIPVEDASRYNRHGAAALSQSSYRQSHSTYDPRQQSTHRPTDTQEDWVARDYRR